MSCPKNIVKRNFLAWSWNSEGSHKWKDSYIPSKLSWWSIIQECEICGSERELWPLKDEGMLRRGYDLNKLPYSGFFGRSADECKPDYEGEE